MRRPGSTRPAALAALALLVLPPALDGQAAAGDVDPSQSAPIAEIEALARARRLVIHGIRSDSADSLVEAARILIDVRPHADSHAIVERPQTRMDGSDKGLHAGATAETLLEIARTLAENRSELLDTIEELEARARPVVLRGAPVGAAEGPRKEEGRVPGETRELWRIAFEAGTEAIVRVIGDGDTNLDLYVYDEAGTLVASDDDLSDDGLAQWVPAEAGVYRVVIDNLGPVHNEYWLITN